MYTSVRERAGGGGNGRSRGTQCRDEPLPEDRARAASSAACACKCLTAAEWMPGAAASTPKARGGSALNDRAFPSASVTLPPASVTISAAAAMSHSLPQRSDAAIRSEEHTSELQSLMRISYAVFCLKKKIKPSNNTL